LALDETKLTTSLMKNVCRFKFSDADATRTTTMPIARPLLTIGSAKKVSVFIALTLKNFVTRYMHKFYTKFITRTKCQKRQN